MRKGINVQIYESKFGRIKYNIGHSVRWAWAVGGVEETPVKKFFLVEVTDRSMDALTEVVRQHVLPGSIIVTDLWRGYNGLIKFLWS